MCVVYNGNEHCVLAKVYTKTRFFIFTVNIPCKLYCFFDKKMVSHTKNKKATFNRFDVEVHDINLLACCCSVAQHDLTNKLTV